MAAALPHASRVEVARIVRRLHEPTDGFQERSADHDDHVSRTRHELQLAGILSDDLAESLKIVLSKLAHLEDQLGAPKQLHR